MPAMNGGREIVAMADSVNAGGAGDGNPNLLLIDEELSSNLALREHLEKDGFSVRASANVFEGLRALAECHASVVVCDLGLAGTEKASLFSAARASRYPVVIVFTSGIASIEGAVEAYRLGAFDYVTKPVDPVELRGIISRAYRHARMIVPATPSSPAIPRTPMQPKMLVGRSPRMAEVCKRIARAGMTESNVLILGESGTGKELVARAIHENSSRASRRFVAVNCGSIVETLLESELFGHVRGAFTGASCDKRGLFEEANGGTLLLDEIGDISPSFQVKLLRVIQEGEIRPVGASFTRKVNVRIMAATHRNLERMVREDRFRQDLYFRLNVLKIELAPLRERLEDLPVLVDEFLSRFSEKNGKSVRMVSEDAIETLLRYPWPGNVRELENAMERAVSLTRGAVLYPEDFPDEIVGFASRAENETAVMRPLLPRPGGSLEDLERDHILRVLREAGFNKSRAAHVLGIDRATLYRKAQRYKIPLEKPQDNVFRPTGP